MSKMFDYISGKTDGDVARLEAEREHALGYLDLELAEGQKLRAEIASLRERVRVLEGALVSVRAEVNLERAPKLMAKIETALGIRANEPVAKETQT